MSAAATGTSVSPFNTGFPANATATAAAGKNSLRNSGTSGSSVSPFNTRFPANDAGAATVGDGALQPGDLIYENPPPPQTMAEQAMQTALAQTAAENAGNANNALVRGAPGWGGRILTRNQLLDRRDLVDKSQANILKTLQSRPLDGKTFRRTPVTIPGPTNDTALLNAKQIRTAVLALESATMNPIQRGNLANSYLQAACDLMREGTGRLLKAGDRQQSPECEAQLHDAVADFVAAVQFVILSRYKMTPDLKPQEDKTFQQLVKLNDLLKKADGFTFKQTAGEREDLTDYIAKLESGSVKQTIQSGGGRKKSSSLVKTKKPTATKKPAAKKK